MLRLAVQIFPNPQIGACGGWGPEAEHLVCVYLDIICALFWTGEFYTCFVYSGKFIKCHCPFHPPRFPRPAVRHRDMEPPSTSRPLAPAPPNARRSQSERRSQPQRENASSACSACKTRKQKVQLIHSRLVTNINTCDKKSNDFRYVYMNDQVSRRSTLRLLL